MRRIETLFVEANRWALILLLGAMSAIVFSNVALRYLTSFSLAWSEEVARYMMIWMTFLGAGLVLRQGGHVAISTVTDRFGARTRVVLRIVVVAILLVFFVVMIRFGLDYMQRMGRQLTPATRIPFRHVYVVIPVGFALLAVHLLLIVKAFVLGRDLDPESPEGDDRPFGGG
ncbi:MAG: TRAP transporter small permease [Roseovarius sp.]|nr:TRAP transporter small permease [Roseovarius sp.]